MPQAPCQNIAACGIVKQAHVGVRFFLQHAKANRCQHVDIIVALFSGCGASSTRICVRSIHIFQMQWQVLQLCRHCRNSCGSDAKFPWPPSARFIDAAQERFDFSGRHSLPLPLGEGWGVEQEFRMARPLPA